MTEEPDDQSALHRNLCRHMPKARKRLALSTASVAALAGLDDGVVRAIEVGDEPEVTIWELQRLAKTLGLSFRGLPRDGVSFEDDDVC